MSRPLRSNPKTMHRAIELRKESTPAEAKLWDYIRNDQPSVNFRRQHAIGNYIPDSYSRYDLVQVDLSQATGKDRIAYTFDKEVTQNTAKLSIVLLKR